MNTTTWIKRSAALLASATAALAMMGPTAQAGQTGPVVFTVQASVAAACTATSAATFNFGTYTTGQAAAVNGEMDVDITCPGSSATNSMPVTLQLKPIETGTSAGFEMSAGGTGAAPFLTYSLCDTSCTTGTVYGNNTPGPSIPVVSGATAQTYQLFGQIAGGQAPTASTTYQQTVDAYVNY